MPAKQNSAPKKRVYVKFTPEKIQEITEQLFDWLQTTKKIWLGEFAAKHHIHRNRLAELAEKDEGFKSVYELAKQEQENWLFLGGASGELNPAMCIFSLKNVAGWRDSKDVNHTGIEKENRIVIIRDGDNRSRNKTDKETTARV